ncbi:hypothetical protein [Bradyrhizobium sp. USDA 3315]
MATRRKFLAGAAVATSALASTKWNRARAAGEAPKMGEFLFVQTSKGMTFDKGSSKLTLTGISPITVYFTDRPERIAGNMKTAAFIPFWSEGKDSFKSDPPNADISLLENGGLTQIIAELQEPVLNGDDLSYTVKVLKGEVPVKANDVSVFIDIIGRPLTPMSFAGVGRRAYRRAYW